jgi:hypothetical protein
MQRKILLGIAVAVSLALPAVAFAASVHRKPLVIHPWHGYGFLPGYHQPPSNSVPVYGPKGAIGDTDYAPRYWYDGGQYYFGNPGFFPRTLQRRQLRSVLDPYTYRTDLELRMSAATAGTSMM